MSAQQPPLERLAYRIEEAAQAIGVSPDFFAANIKNELRIVRKGRVRLIPRSELTRWLDENASYTLDAA